MIVLLSFKLSFDKIGKSSVAVLWKERQLCQKMVWLAVENIFFVCTYCIVKLYSKIVCLCDAF